MLPLSGTPFAVLARPTMKSLTVACWSPVVGVKVNETIGVEVVNPRKLVELAAVVENIVPLLRATVSIPLKTEKRLLRNKNPPIAGFVKGLGAK